MAVEAKLNEIISLLKEISAKLSDLPGTKAGQIVDSDKGAKIEADNRLVSIAKKQRVSRYEVWAKAHNDKIFKAAIKGDEARLAMIEKEMPGFLQSIREINKP